MHAPLAGVEHCDAYTALDLDFPSLLVDYLVTACCVAVSERYVKRLPKYETQQSSNADRIKEDRYTIGEFLWAALQIQLKHPGVALP